MAYLPVVGRGIPGDLSGPLKPVADELQHAAVPSLTTRRCPPRPLGHARAPTDPRHTHHLRNVLVTAVLLSTLAVGGGAEIGHAQPSSPRQPRFTYLEQPTTEAKDIIAWAVADTARRSATPGSEGLFPGLLRGRGALYHVGERSIEFCQITRRNALHEFAHAWDDTSGAVDREAFLKLRA